jgi:hypothetical protein
MKPAVTIFDAIDDPNVFGPWFRDRATWTAWFAFLAGLFALPMSPEQWSLFRACTGRTNRVTTPFQEAWLICGRRSGKSFVLAVIAVFLAVFRDWRPYLQPGERATILVIAADRKQARVILRYMRALVTEVPMLARLVERETAESLDLSNSVTIEIATASFRRTRGYALAAVLMDELAFWSTDDAAEPDREVIAAVRGGMVQFPSPLLMCASSPYAKKGALWDAFNKHHGEDAAPALVWKAPTRTMNPTVPQAVIDAAYEQDPAHASAEYGAEFRSDVQAIFSLEAVRAVVDSGVRERPPLRDHRYHAFVDPSGGSADSMTIAVAHKEGVTTVLDVTREVRPPFNPETVVAEFSTLLKQYRISSVRGDRYGGEWVASEFKKQGIAYIPSERTKSAIYRDLLPALNSGAVALLDDPRLVSQLVNLERRPGRQGADNIDHPSRSGAHDDLANAAAGALIVAGDGEGRIVLTRDERQRAYERSMREFGGSGADPLAGY